MSHVLSPIPTKHFTISKIIHKHIFKFNKLTKKLKTTQRFYNKSIKIVR